MNIDLTNNTARKNKTKPKNSSIVTTTINNITTKCLYLCLSLSTHNIIFIESTSKVYVLSFASFSLCLCSYAGASLRRVFI